MRMFCFDPTGSMEAGGVASKPKKRGKGSKAADEARRREALKENLREKLALESRALQIVERLLEDNVTEEFLISCVWHITHANYKDTVEERAIAKLCGYPLCSNKLHNVPTQQFKISTKTNKVYDITERKCFCSNFCYKASKHLELQISKTPLWLRKDERPSEIKLIKEGGSGSSGHEVMLVDKPITEDDIENPIQDIADPSKNLPVLGNSDSSDTEQDFVSSLVTGHHKPARVHWGKLPKRDGNSDPDEPRHDENQPECTERASSKNIVENRSTPQKNGQGSTTEDNHPTDKVKSVESKVEESWELLKHCSLEDSHTVSQEAGVPSQPETGISTPASRGLNITQVGMSKRGAADLKNLLMNHNKAKSAPNSISLCLVEALRQTFMEWRTEETMKFLYGPGYASETELKTQQVEENEEELDEDDLDEVQQGVELSAEGPAKPSASVPDFNTLRKETEQLDLRVREFYKGVCVLPEELDTESVKEKVDMEGSGKDPPLPLVDSNAQHLIQKRIVVEKLTRSLRDVLGPLRLTMSDVINDINNLVRTFRFTNKNIIHKSPEWTLIAVVLLSVLTKLSPLMKESLASPSSVEYISSLMRELKLNDEDLHSLVLLFKPQIISQQCTAPKLYNL